MFLKKFFASILLFGGTIALTKAHTVDRVLPNGESTVVEHEKLRPVTKPYDMPLRFDTPCAKNILIMEYGTDATRKTSDNTYNYATAVTQRPLKSNELFEVSLYSFLPNWFGNLQIGVTLYSTLELNCLPDMQFETSGTWVLIADHVYQNGTEISKAYGENLNDLRKRDRAGVMRKDNGDLHFFINGVDQGVAARDVPEGVYGFVDVYGRAQSVIIVDNP